MSPSSSPFWRSGPCAATAASLSTTRPTGKALRWLLLLVIASAVAILATLAHVAYYFQRVSPVGLVANLLVVPLLGYDAVVAGFVGLAAGWVWEAPGALLLHLAAFLLRWSDQLVEYLSQGTGS